MSVINAVLEEVKETLLTLDGYPVDLTGRVIICYDEDSLLDALKGVRSLPVVGIVYEGMRAVTAEAERGSTEKLGISSELSLMLVLVEVGDAIHASYQKQTRAVDYLDAMRGKFMARRSTVTRHRWHFLVESPAELKKGTVCWVQRWTLPVQLTPVR